MLISQLKIAIFSAAALVGGMAGVDAARADPFFAKGDVMASTSGGTVTVYDKNLNLVTTLDTTMGGFTTGSVFDKAGNFYVTDFSSNAVSVFSGTTGALTGTFGSGYNTPEAIFSIPRARPTSPAWAAAVSCTLTRMGTRWPAQSLGLRTDWEDLHSDQVTMLYTDEGSTIHAVNVATDTTLPDFGSTFGTNGFALREIPKGPDAGDVLVAAGNQISLLTSTDVLLKSYTDPLGANGQWFALNLDPNGTSFWSGDDTNGEIAQFDIATGAVLQSRLTCGGSCLFGLSVAGEISSVNPGVPEPATWAMMLIGFTGLGFLGYRSSKKQRAALAAG